MSGLGQRSGLLRGYHRNHIEHCQDYWSRSEQLKIYDISYYSQDQSNQLAESSSPHHTLI